MDETTEETEKPMEDQAFDHYEKGISEELHGKNEEAHGEYQTAVILDSSKEVYIESLKRTERYQKNQRKEQPKGGT